MCARAHADTHNTPKQLLFLKTPKEEKWRINRKNRKKGLERTKQKFRHEPSLTA